MRLSTKGDTSVAREVLRYAATFNGLTVCIAPSGIGPIARGDLDMFLQDVELLSKLGMGLFTADYCGGTFWEGLEWPKNLRRLFVTDDKDLVAVAKNHGAGKLCLVSGTDRIVIRGHQLDSVSLARAKSVLADGDGLTRQSRHVLELAVSACEAGIPRDHVVNAHRDGALLDEFFTNLGVGTMVFAGTPHKEVRTMTTDDRHSVCALLRNAIPRETGMFVREHLEQLRVYAVDSDVHGVSRVTSRGDTIFVLVLAHSARSNVAEVLEGLLRAALDEARKQRAGTLALSAGPRCGGGDLVRQKSSPAGSRDRYCGLSSPEPFRVAAAQRSTQDQGFTPARPYLLETKTEGK